MATVKSKSASVVQRSSTSPGSGNIPRPPSPGSPNTPAGYAPLTKAAIARLHKMTDNQASSLAAVGGEILASNTYQADFGSDAPNADNLADGLGLAEAWQAEVANAERWLVYADNQRELAVDAAMVLMNGLGDEVHHLLRKHPDLAQRYPQVVAFSNARNEAGLRGARTRKSKVKKAAKK